MESIVTMFIVYIWIFLFGLFILKTGIQQISYHKMKMWIKKYTSNPIKGFLIGVGITAILQSSSTTIVIIVSLTSLGLLYFPNAIAIILGANVGTTLTAELLSFSNFWLMWILLISGFILLCIHKQRIFSIGCMLFGLGTIFTALYGFESLAEPIRQTPYMEEGLYDISRETTYSILFGMVVTGITQSSSAFTGMIMSFMNQDLLSLPSAIAMVLGANIGTCFTALLAAIGSKMEGKWTAYAHLWVNILGVLFFIPFINWLGDFVSHLSAIPGRQLAHASVIFNLIISSFFLLFIKPLSAFIKMTSRRA
ncbi:Na/Pi cotransporter family protein [Virgibacillus sp. MSP4-1]|uniref:Na/Pi symporter n=1 Tax=Virgibacillus sp. MSP4-1 TaxID=2700081 RepID=UPI0003A2B3E7|nr:Na/Pi symporter [Virgibacillus sp. MSP4-1]QHS22802.1 Na/Pi cotransporter family protein [Virgibacillus sp. MSP4-1]